MKKLIFVSLGKEREYLSKNHFFQKSSEKIGKTIKSNGINRLKMNITSNIQILKNLIL